MFADYTTGTPIKHGKIRFSERIALYATTEAQLMPFAINKIRKAYSARSLWMGQCLRRELPLGARPAAPWLRGRTLVR
jgi:hypothetical protein